MRINQNIGAFNAYRNLSATNAQQQKSLEKLSSGFRINRAADDAAGLSISEGLRSQVGGLKVAVRNAQDGVSVVQTAEGALSEVHAILQRIRDLSVQAANSGSQDSNAVQAAQTEVDGLLEEIDRIGLTTTFGQQALLDGSFGKTTGKLSAYDADGSVTFTAADAFTVSVAGGSGAVSVAVEGVTKTGGDVATYLEDQIKGALLGTGNAVDAAAAENLSVKAEASGTGYTYTVENGGSTAVTFAESTNTPLADAGFDLATDAVAEAATGTGGVFQVGANNSANDRISVAIGEVSASALGINTVDLTSDAQSAIDDVDTAIQSISTTRANLGAYQNRFEHTIANLQVTQENLAASESRIRDTDMASEMVSFTRHQILSQAGTAMLAQANQMPQSVLALLR